MNRSIAAVILEEELSRLEDQAFEQFMDTRQEDCRGYRFHDHKANQRMEALRTAIRILNGEEELLAGWTATMVRRPEPADASKTGHVLALKAKGCYVTAVKADYCTPRAYPYWMPFPQFPAANAGETDKEEDDDE